MKQTAVEWLWENIENTRPNLEWYKILKQAKEMEKQQIKDAFNEGYFDEKSAEQYYNETFKKE
jgi:hypothetical protein